MVTHQWSFLTSPPLLLGLALDATAEPREIALTLGEYRFTPPQLEVVAGEPLVLRLTNTDRLTPHNLSLAGGGLELDVEVPAGQTLAVEITPREPGRHDFFCNKKPPFLKSHRERGMEGVLLVRPAP